MYIDLKQGVNFAKGQLASNIDYSKRKAWDMKYKPNSDWNHAWGAAPANIITRRMFGIRPYEAGFKTAIIEPKITGLTHCAIKHPTINGFIEVHFKKTRHNKLKFTIKNDMNAHFVVPDSLNVDTIKINGEIINIKKTAPSQAIVLEKGVNSIVLGYKN